MAEQQNSIANLSLIELKALAFDQIALIEQSQANMKILQNEMRLRVEQNKTQPTLENEVIAAGE